MRKNQNEDLRFVEAPGTFFPTFAVRGPRGALGTVSRRDGRWVVLGRRGAFATRKAAAEALR